MTTTTAAADRADLDLANLELWRDGPPHELFAQLRREPMHFSALEGFEHERGFWSVVRFEDIANVGRDHRTFSSARSIVLVDKLSWDPELPDPLDFGQHMMITTDPPRHDRMKALVQRAFTPKRALEHAGRSREIINLVYDRALEAHPDGRIDLVQDVGVHVPAMVIGDMLGVPRAHAEQLVDWTNRTTAFEDPRLVPNLRDVWHAAEELFPYIDAMIEERHERPTDDLTTAFIGAEVDGAHVRAGDKLALWYVSGNRDETVFEDPNRFDVRRATNPHQGFGGGGRLLPRRRTGTPRAGAVDRRDAEALPHNRAGRQVRPALLDVPQPVPLDSRRPRELRLASAERSASRSASSSRTSNAPSLAVDVLAGRLVARPTGRGQPHPVGATIGRIGLTFDRPFGCS
ncbi:MAG: hypothetical protein ACLP01_20945 [Solirubrobacteraceae bacterium]